jgi:polysaccharide biosynthesis transport protein
MNIISFLRLIYKHKWVLLLTPLFMGGMAFFLTKHEKKLYSSRTTIYTGIASGYSIESQDNAKVDYFATNNAFDNMLNIIKSRETLEELGLKLFIQHMMLKEPDNKYIRKDHYDELMKITPLDVKLLIDNNSVENTFQNLENYKSRNDTNFVYKLINLYHPNYSIDALSKIEVKRIGNSDLIEINFTSNDPGICQQTLILLNEIFVKTYSNIEANQTDAVVRYFENQLKNAEVRLNLSEDRMLNFNKDNKIINYYEQSKHIASQKEKFELEVQRVQLDYAASREVLDNLERKMDISLRARVQNQNILQLRKELSNITTQLTILGIDSNLNEEEDNEEDNINIEEQSKTLLKQSLSIRRKIRQSFDTLNIYMTTPEGVAMKQVMDEWLINIINYEEAKAKLTTLHFKRKEFDSLYLHYAPLGATQKRIEREINVNEQEYLSLLHSLALAKLKQQNVEMKSDLKVVDNPSFPLTPLPSKRKILVIIAALVGFIIPLTIILLLEYFDSCIRNPKRAINLTQLPLLGIFPNLKEKQKLTEPDFFVRRSTEILCQQFISESKLLISTQKKENVIWSVCSIQSGEGKSMLINKLISLIEESGLEAEKVEYDKDVISKLSMDVNQKKKIFIIEIPSFSDKYIDYDIFNLSDGIALVCNANRKWTDADKNAIDRLKKMNSELNIFLILNGVSTQIMESILGELPKKRSFLRRWIKRIILMQFFYKKFS